MDSCRDCPLTCRPTGGNAAGCFLMFSPNCSESVALGLHTNVLPRNSHYDWTTKRGQRRPEPIKLRIRMEQRVSVRLRRRQPLFTLILARCHRRSFPCDNEDYTPSLRRTIPARPSNPMPSSMALPGSGVVVAFIFRYAAGVPSVYPKKSTSGSPNDTPVTAPPNMI
jgi:hypothetical protein